jgi:hypothetical protein
LLTTKYGNTFKEKKMGIEDLLKLDVSKHIEKKNGLSYLSWAWAWTQALKADPKSTYKVETFQEHGQNGACRTVPYMSINGTAMVCVTVTMFDKPMTCQLPVMDYRNKAIQEPDAFAVNTAIMRCMAKALALHGLGLFIYAGEDLPEEGDVPKKGPGAVVTPRGGIGEDLPQDVKDFLLEMAASVEELVNQGKAVAALAMIDEQALEADQRVWLANQMSSTVRAALKKAKG